MLLGLVTQGKKLKSTIHVTGWVACFLKIETAPDVVHKNMMEHKSFEPQNKKDSFFLIFFFLCIVTCTGYNTCTATQKQFNILRLLFVWLSEIQMRLTRGSFHMMFPLKSHRCLTKRTPFQPCSPENSREKPLFSLKIKMLYYRNSSPFTFNINPFILHETSFYFEMK